MLKNASTEVLIDAICTVHSGEKYFDEDVKASLSNEDRIENSKLIKKDGLCELTTREIEILKLIAEGNSNKQIGDKINISHRTVDTHRTNIMKKIGVNNIAGIIRFAMQRGIID